MSSAPRYLQRAGRSSVPAPTPIADALKRQGPLAQLGHRLQASRERLKVIAPALPAGLLGSVQPGPLDEDGWTLLAANSAVAAKLRQLLPRLQARLTQAGLAPAHIRVKLLQR